MSRFIDIHVVQTIPYANLNRDDTNSVKTVQYGGVERTRVSSQSWKRATRPAFESQIGEKALRTRRIGERVAEELVGVHGWDESLAKRAGQHILLGSGIKAESPKKNPETDDQRDWTLNAMVYVPQTAVGELAELAIKHRDAVESAKGDAKSPKDSVFDPKEVQAILRSRNGVINLYGRMLAEVDDAAVDGAVQVAHAFTTHATVPEIDYFAAVDDLTESWGQTGSAHIGEAEYSAGTFYRYATIDVATLTANLGPDATAVTQLVSAFAHAFVMSVPQAKKTATAPHTVPALVYAVVRKDRPVSLAAAFEQPIRPDNGGGFEKPSVLELDRYATQLEAFLGGDGVIHRAHAAIAAGQWEGFGTRAESLPKLIDNAVTEALTEAPQ